MNFVQREFRRFLKIFFFILLNWSMAYYILHFVKCQAIQSYGAPIVIVF